MPTASLRDLLRFLRRERAGLKGSDAPDGALLERFVAQRDEAAFETLLSRHGAMVLGVCQRVVGDAHTAEDAFQATFLVLARRAGSIRDHASVGSWLHGVAQRIACKARAQATSRRERERRTVDMARSEPLDELTWQELRAVLDEEVGRLPEKYRAAVVLCHLEGKSYEQAAKELGWAKSSLASRLGKAHQMLRVQLVRRGFALSAGAVATVLAEKATAAPVAAMSALNIVKAATSVAAGKTLAAGILSTRAIALAEEAMKTMIGIKGRLVLLLLALGLTVGAGYAVYGAWVGQTPPPRAEEKQPPVAQGEPGNKEALGDPLPAGAVARLGQDRWLHDIMARFAAFTPDGEKVVTVNIDRTIRVWEFPTGKEIRRIAAPAPDLSAAEETSGFTAALAKDGKTIATWRPEERSAIYLHDIATGKQLAGLKLPVAKESGPDRLRVTDISALAFSPDGIHLADAARNGMVRIWDWAKAKEVRSFAAGKPIGELNWVWGISYAPNGKSIATYQAGEVKLWNPDTGVEIRTIRGDRIITLAFSPDGNTLAIAGVGDFDGGGARESSVVLVETATGKEISKLTIPERLQIATGGAAFGKDGSRLYVCGFGGLVMEWDVASGKLLRECKHTTVGGSIEVSPDGKMLVGIGVGPPFLDLGGKDITPLDSKTAPLVSLHFTPDGSKVLTVGSGTGDPSDQSVRTFDAITGKEIGKLTGKEIRKANPPDRRLVPAPIALSPNGKVVAAAIPPQFTNEGKVSKAATVVLVELATGTELGQLPARAEHRMRFSPDSKILAIGTRSKIELFGVPDGKLRQTLEVGHTMFFSPDGKTLAARTNSGTLGLWDTTTDQRIGSVPLPQRSKLIDTLESQSMDSAAFSADGRCLVLDMGDGTAVLYELATAQPRRPFGKKQVPLTAAIPRINYLVPDEVKAGSCFAFSPDGRLLVRGGFDRIVQVWDIQTGKELAAFQGHNEAVTAVAFAPNGKTLASASLDSTALIWDVTKVKRPAAPAKSLQPGALEKHWQALAGDDAANAFDAMGNLIAVPKEAVAWIKDRVKPAGPLDDKRIADLIAQLDDPQFEVRDQAINELRQIGEPLVPALDKALAAKPPLETRRRLEDLRGKLTGLLLQGERLRGYRAVEVLEQIGTRDARAVLQVLADGAPGTLLTTSAQAALKR